MFSFWPFQEASLVLKFLVIPPYCITSTSAENSPSAEYSLAVPRNYYLGTATSVTFHSNYNPLLSLRGNSNYIFPLVSFALARGCELSTSRNSLRITPTSIRLVILLFMAILNIPAYVIQSRKGQFSFIDEWRRLIIDAGWLYLSLLLILCLSVEKRDEKCQLAPFPKKTGTRLLVV